MINIHLPKQIIQLQNYYFSPSLKVKEFNPQIDCPKNIPTIQLGDFNARHTS